MKPVEAVKVKQYLEIDKRLQYGERAAQIAEEIEALEGEKKAVVSDFKARIDKLHAEMDEALKAIRDGYVMVVFAGNRRKNYDQGVWELLDPDTGIVVETKPFGPEDMQMTTEDIAAKNKDQKYEDPDGQDADLDALASKINQNLAVSDEPEIEVAPFDRPIRALGTGAVDTSVEEAEWENVDDLRNENHDASDLTVSVGEDEPVLVEAQVLSTKPEKAAKSKAAKLK